MLKKISQKCDSIVMASFVALIRNSCFLTFVGNLSLSVWASDCQLRPEDGPIRIGMTQYGGDTTYGRALRSAAHELGLNYETQLEIDIVDHGFDGLIQPSYPDQMKRYLESGKNHEDYRARVVEGLRVFDGVLSPGGADPHPYVWAKEETMDQQLMLHNTLANLGSEEKAAWRQTAAVFNTPEGREVGLRQFSYQRKKMEFEKVQGEEDKYGLSQESRLSRDVYESVMLKEYFRNDEFEDMPFLGICYGMQSMALAQGAELTVDINHQLGIPNRRSPEKLRGESTIQTKDETPFQNYTQNSEEIDLLEIAKTTPPSWTAVIEPLKKHTEVGGKVPKNHHQAVQPQQLEQSPIEVLATSNDRKISEVIVSKNRPAIGIQFHVERSTNKELKDAFFKDFLLRACARKMKRKGRVFESGNAHHGNADPRKQHQLKFR